MPVLKKWRIFEREDFTGEAAWMRDDLALLVKELEEASDKFDESKQRYLEREARRTEKITASRVLKSQGTLTLSGH
jgi:acyl-[acyl-carrier-protein] desaturase